MINLSGQKIENLLHRFFDPARPSGVTIIDRYGIKVHPREWFYVLPEHVADAVRLIQAGTLHRYRCDPGSQKVVACAQDSSDGWLCKLSAKRPTGFDGC